MAQKFTKAEQQKAAPKVENTPGSDSSFSELKLKQELSQQYQNSFDSLRYVRLTWDDKEAMMVSRSLDQMTSNAAGSNATAIKSQVNDPRLSTIVIERAARVMAQLPTGKVQALDIDDQGKNLLMNLLLTKYIYPNANAQFDLLTKLRMWDIYSNVYGAFPVLTTWRSSDDYIGPDFELVPMRNFLPQPGRVSVHESEYVFIKTTVTVGWLKKRNRDHWKNLDYIIEKASQGGKDQSSQDVNVRSFVERDRYIYVPGGKGDAALVDLYTRYERDRWVTFAPDFEDTIVRDIKNPQLNNKIPVTLKQCFPLIDSIVGLGEFERGKTLQYAINSLINLYLDGVKMSIFPPIMMQADGIVPSTIRISPGAKWLLTRPNAIETFQTSPEGINSFQSTYSFLNAALLNMAGTTDTTVTARISPGMGKTPEALNMLQQRESARDNWDRFMMEKATEEVFNNMVDLMATQQQEKPIDLTLFEGDIKQIQSQYPDVMEMVKSYKSGKAGQLTVTSKDLGAGKTKYKYFIDAGTSLREDTETINQTLTNMLQLFIHSPQILQAMTQGPRPRSIDFGELISQWVNTSGLQDPSKIVVEIAPPQATPQPQQQPQPQPKESINFKDLPPEGQVQMAQQAGIHLNPPSAGIAPQAPQGPQTPQGPQGPSPMDNQLLAQMMQSRGASQQPVTPQPQMPQQMPQFKDPAINAMARAIAGGPK